MMLLAEDALFSSSPKKVNSTAKSILVVDDDPNVVGSLSRNFRKKGFETLLAYHGTQGYWLACTEKPDLILVDLCMPRGNGESVIESLRSNRQTSHIPIIVFSGKLDYGVENKALSLGADEFLRKPMEFEKIYSCVRNYLG